MVSMRLQTAAAAALVLSQTALAVPFLPNIVSRSEFESMSLEERGAMNPRQLWEGAEIPYILEKLPHDLSEEIRGAMRHWEQSSCIRFVPKKDQKAWVNFKKYDDGCYSAGLGSPGEGEHVVNLDMPNVWENFLSLGTYKKCLDAGTPGHELGHVIGLDHEHQRPDRDEFIRVLENRIQSDWLDQFAKDPSTNTSVPFDYNSIMLYDSKAFAKTNWRSFLFGEVSLKHTMETVTDQKINPWDTPTPSDYRSVNEGYGCEEYYTRMIPECLAGSIPADPEFSSYSFILDKYTEQYMRENNYTHVAAHQRCKANMAGQDTDNWGCTPLNGWGPRAPYKVTTNRCKKNKSRHASRYEVALCRGDNEDACDIMCGLRRVCPWDANNNQVDSKAIDVVDNNLWVCHPH
ncbi:Astacin-like metalloprotease toxin 5 [Colletotrichum spinosum]|uniref:Metalloendopeptidase n=1 Tax=Colletotrichum spinosum TaxID=1347390 RepID=A0A4R8QAJ4_9PEZI|nr:Astacin-like metalloprotease toxin 5 [Colletotrichum spinosum]